MTQDKKPEGSHPNCNYLAIDYCNKCGWMASKKPEVREYLLIEPGDSDLQEGSFATRAYEKSNFPKHIWAKRIVQANDPESGYVHVIEHSHHTKLIEEKDARIRELQSIVDYDTAEFEKGKKKIERQEAAIVYLHGRLNEHCGGLGMKAIREKLAEILKEG